MCNHTDREYMSWVLAYVILVHDNLLYSLDPALFLLRTLQSMGMSLGVRIEKSILTLLHLIHMEATLQKYKQLCEHCDKTPSLCILQIHPRPEIENRKLILCAPLSAHCACKQVVTMYILCLTKCLLKNFSAVESEQRICIN